MLQLLTDYMLGQDQKTFAFVQGDQSTCSQKEQWIVQALLLKSSQMARQQALQIFKKLLSNKQLHLPITETLLKYLEFSLEIDPLSSEEYFYLLTQLLTQ